ncbi:MAG: stage II sporulation protein P [Syntrophomonadaceae bacterium]|jgi:stage II sporulation protein P|nr:stage II sporulation protein P [Syntrophomonadaceae bacterium]
MPKKLLIITLSLTILWTLMGVSLCSANEEMPSGQYFTLVDENNNIIHQTAMRVHEGDEYISADNARYKVVEIQGDIAICAYQGEERMPVVSFDSRKQAWVFKGQEIAVLSGEQKSTIAVYHTHSDESYVPSDGTESREGNGGIYDVGQAFVDELKSLGFNVQYNKNNHNPHDINAYNRSRKTALTLIKKENPNVVVDIHRDAVPPDVYQAKVEGQDVTKIKLVVGKQNPNMKTNLEFAKQIKAVMDKQSPGLSNGIFMGKGDYNQDLSPRAILLEVGAHTNDKKSATEGVKLFAGTMQSVLAGNSDGNKDPEAKPLSQNEQGGFTSVIILLVVVAAAGGGFYLLNKGYSSK